MAGGRRTHSSRTRGAVSGYSFLFTVNDGQKPGGGGIDKFRIKILDRDNGDAIICDNVLNETADDIDNAKPQQIDCGSIVIHK